MTPIEIGNVLSERFKTKLRFLPDPTAFHDTVSYHAVWGWGSDERSEIGWNPADGLIALLHEYGHAKHRHRVDQYHQSGPASYAALLRAEHEAWLEAEEFAHEFGVEFDYAEAEKAFKSYSHTPEGLFARLFQPDAPFKVEWRYKNGGAK